MKRKWLLVLVLALCFTGCQRGNDRITPVIEGQKAPHAGWNLGPDMYVEQGDIVKLTGVVLYTEWLDPNDLLE